jgi:D-ribose pyranose/furanose isomerase RbsD
MNLKEQIKEWLESEEKDFNQGLQLYIEASHNRSVMLYLQRKNNHEKLTYELNKLLKQVPARLEKQQAIPFASKANITNKKSRNRVEKSSTHKILQPRKIDREKLPEDLQKVYDSVGDQYKIQRNLHEKMKLAETDESRAQLREQLVEVDDYISKAWNAIDLFIKTGQEPKSEDKKDVDKLKAINSARSYISKGLNALEKLTDKKKEERIAAICERVDLLIKLDVSVKAETRAELIRQNVIKENSKLKVD